MSFISRVRSIGTAAALFAASALTSQAAAFVYVGSWDFATLGGGVEDFSNPYWWKNNPPVYSAVEAAAILFGGSPSDYAISTLGTNPANINHLAFVDGWSDTQYMTNPTSETFSLDAGAPGYNEPSGFGTAYSALVFDHGANFPNAINYAFRRIEGVPEAAGISVFGIAAVALLMMRIVVKRRLDHPGADSRSDLAR